MGKFRNNKLRAQMTALAVPAPTVKKRKTATVKRKEAAALIEKPNTINVDGGAAYAVEDHLRLLSMLNTLKLESQFYKSETTQMKELQALINKCAKADTYFTAQCVVYRNFEPIVFHLIVLLSKLLLND